MSSGLVAMYFLENVSEDYATDEDGLPPISDNHSGVEVPEVGFSLESEQYRNVDKIGRGYMKRCDGVVGVSVLKSVH